MENKMLLFSCIMVLGVLISGVSQMMLKKAAGKRYDKWYQQYLNPLVVVAYLFFVLSTVCSVIGLRVVPLSMNPVWNAMGYIFVTLLGWFIFKEKINRRKGIGMLLILCGIVLFSLKL